jgi:hypothetical protein
MFNIKDKPPINWRLILLIILINIHFFLLISIYFEMKYLFLLVIEAVFYFYYSKNIKSILRMIVIGIIVFILNSFFYEGKILFQYGIIKMTEEGIKNGFEKSGILIALFIFTQIIY